MHGEISVSEKQEQPETCIMINDTTQLLMVHLTITLLQIYF